MSALTFTPGKFYKTRDGRKYECLKANVRFAMTGDSGLVGLHYADNGGALLTSHFLNGRRFSDVEDGADLIAEWVDAPEVDWSKMPAWANWVAQDSNGCWMWYSDAPNLWSTDWICPHPVPSTWMCDDIPPAYCPKWSGEWRDSLVTRPTEGGK